MSDIVVVGAGIVGCAVAQALVQEGHTVRVLEARSPGDGATRASAGVLAPYIEGHDSDVLCALGRRSLGLFDRFVGNLGAARQAVYYERRGTLEVALDADAAARLTRLAATLESARVEARWLEPDALRRLEPAIVADVRGALHVPLHGYVAVPALTAALAADAADRGARFESGVEVSTFASNPSGGVVVKTSRGDVAVDMAVLAAGSWSSRIGVAGRRDVPVRPIRGQLLHLSLPERCLTHVVWGPRCYLVPWPDGSVLVGATVEDVGFDERSTARGVAGLLDAACALVPALSNAAFVGVRVGLRPAGPDELPFIGRSPGVPGLIYATGHFRNGVLLAPLTAELVRALAAGKLQDAALSALDPARAGLP